MSESEEEYTHDSAQLDVARATMAVGIAQYADGWDSTEGAVVTTFICIAEVVRIDGGRSLLELYCHGDGAPTIRNWNHEGMLWSALNDPAGER